VPRTARGHRDGQHAVEGGGRKIAGVERDGRGIVAGQRQHLVVGQRLAWMVLAPLPVAIESPATEPVVTSSAPEKARHHIPDKIDDDEVAEPCNVSSTLSGAQAGVKWNCNQIHLTINVDEPATETSPPPRITPSAST